MADTNSNAHHDAIQPAANVGTPPFHSLTDAPEKPAEIAVTWPQSSQRILVTLVILALLLLSWQMLSHWPHGGRPTELEMGQPLRYRVNLNSAPMAEIMQLPGVGPKLAQSIVDYRDENGDFQNWDELTNVPGIGPKTVRRLKQWVTVKGNDAPINIAAVPAKNGNANPLPQAPPQGKKLAPGQTININTASAAELQLLPRIGPTLSQRIIAEREVEPFVRVDDLQRVHGIGAKTVENLRPLITVD